MAANGFPVEIVLRIPVARMARSYGEPAHFGTNAGAAHGREPDFRSKSFPAHPGRAQGALLQ